MNIGQVAKLTGLSIKQIRDYEKTGLLIKPQRTLSNYRHYGERELARLYFIAKARQVGFSLAQIGQLLDLQDNPARKSCEVKTLTGEHIAFLEQQIAKLEQMKATLQAWNDACHGDDNPDCPILKSLGG